MSSRKAARVSARNRRNARNSLKVQTIESLVKVASTLDVPPWALLLPGLAPCQELLAPGALKGLEGLVQSYLACDPARRSRIERFVARQRAS